MFEGLLGKLNYKGNSVQNTGVDEQMDAMNHEMSILEDDGSNVQEIAEKIGLLPMIMAMMKKHGRNAAHYKSNKGGPVDSSFEPNYNDSDYQPLGGSDRPPSVGDYSGGSSSGQGWSGGY